MSENLKSITANDLTLSKALFVLENGKNMFDKFNTIKLRMKIYENK